MHKRVADAKAYYVKALKMYPSSVAMNNLGYIYMLYGLDPDIRTLHQPYAATMKMGNDAMQKKEFRMALYYYNEIYTFNTNDIDLLNNITGALLELGSYDLAKKYLDKSYAINQKAPDTYFFYGYLAFKQGKITEAIASLQRVLQLQPNHAAARSNLQFLLEKYPSISPIPSPMNPVQK